MGVLEGFRFKPESRPGVSLLSTPTGQDICHLDLLNGHSGQRSSELIESGRTMDGAPSTGQAGWERLCSPYCSTSLELWRVLPAVQTDTLDYPSWTSSHTSSTLASSSPSGGERALLLEDSFYQTRPGLGPCSHASEVDDAHPLHILNVTSAHLPGTNASNHA